MDTWTQLWVTGENWTRQGMRRVDQHLQQLGAVMHVPNDDGLPVADADGTYEVRVLFGNLGFVKSVLTEHYGLTVVREETHHAE